VNDNQSASGGDESDASWENEEWAGFGEVGISDGSEASDDESVDNDDQEEKQGEPSGAQAKAPGQFPYAHYIWVELYFTFQGAIYRRD
jgi:hypothetical protein